MFLEILLNSQENTCARFSFLIKLQAWGLILLSIINAIEEFNAFFPTSKFIWYCESSVISYIQKQPAEVFRKKRCSLKFRKIHRKTSVPESAAEACKFIKKETLAQVFSWEFCEISNNTFTYKNTSGCCFCICKLL